DLCIRLQNINNVYRYDVKNTSCRIVNLKWFLNCGRYNGVVSVSLDLTKIYTPRVRLPWSFGTAKWNYDKGDLPDRYEFEWPEDAGVVVNGYPIEVKAPFVTDGKKEQVTVGLFMADLDTMVYNSARW